MITSLRVDLRFQLYVYRPCDRAAAVSPCLLLRTLMTGEESAAHKPEQRAQWSLLRACMEIGALATRRPQKTVHYLFCMVYSVAVLLSLKVLCIFCHFLNELNEGH